MKNKGFTLVEILAAISIIAILSIVGIVSVNSVLRRSRENYYKDTESTLLVSGSNYFAENRGERPVDDYNFVDLATLEDKGLVENIVDHSGGRCDSNSGVYIYKTEESYSYEVCLICGGYQSTGPLCGGVKPGVISITANYKGTDNVVRPYNPLLSFANAEWVRANDGINITFGLETGQVKNYIVYNLDTNDVKTSCNATNNSCKVTIKQTGQYYVIGYDQEGVVIGNKKNFVVKNDTEAPDFVYSNYDKEFIMGGGEYYTYNNRILNLKDNFGIASLKYMMIPQSEYALIKGNDQQVLSRLNTSGVDILKNNVITHKIKSGNYALTTVATDFAGNYKRTSDTTIENILIKYPVKLVFTGRNNVRVDAGTINVYTGGNYPLPTTVNGQGAVWYYDVNYENQVTADTIITKTSSHTLYGKATAVGTIPIPSSSNCLDITYNGADQRLVNAITGTTITNHTHQTAGNYNVTFSVNEGYEWLDPQGINGRSRRNVTITCTIKKRPTTCTSSSASKEYDDTALERKTHGSCTNLVSGHESVFTNLGTITNVGSVTNTISSVVIYRNNKTEDVTVNYEMTKVNGTLTISKRDVTITAGSVDVVYDAVEHKTAACSGNRLVSGHAVTCTMTSASKRTNAGTTNNVINTRVIKKGSTDVTSNYNITNANGTIKITPKPVTITAGSVEVVYDAAEHKTASCSGDALISGHAVTCTMTSASKRTNAGTTDNVISTRVIKSGSTDVTSNYSITNAKGTIKINKKAATVTADSNSKTYDGSALTDSGCTATGLISGHTVTCTMTSASTITNAGSKDNVISAPTIKSGGTVVTDNYSITKSNGILTVNKAGSTTTCSNKTYNGSQQTIASCSSGSSSSNNKQTNVGTYTVNCNGDANHNDSSNTCYIYCKKDWIYVSQETGLSSCSESNNGSVKYTCTSSTSCTTGANEQCWSAQGTYWTGSSSSYSSKEAADADCAAHKYICDQDCGGSGGCRSWSCQTSCTTTYTKKKYQWKCP